jgi:uncharacterized delta-60 repeat protein
MTFKQLFSAASLCALSAAASADGLIVLDGGGSDSDFVQQSPRVGTDGRVHLILNNNAGTSRVVVLDASGSLAAGFGTTGKLALPGQYLLDLDVSGTNGFHKLRQDVVQRVDTALDVFWTSPAFLDALPHGSTGGGANTVFLRLADGRILAGGKFRTSAMSPENEEWTLARLTTQGTLDPAFNAGAVLRHDFIGAASNGAARMDSLHLLPNGQYQATGRAQIGSAGFVTMVSRYNTNGTIDFSFGSTGQLVLPDTIGKTVIDAGDRVYFISTDGRVTRTEQNFTLDNTYTVGTANTLLSITDVALDSSGRALIFGTVEVSGVQHAYVARRDTSGNPDASFNGTGSASVTFPQATVQSCRGAVQPDGKPLLACTVTGPSDPNGVAPIDFAVARFTSTGSLDASFGAAQVDTDQFPDAFSFPPVTVDFGTAQVVSAPITVSGINTAAQLRVSPSNASFSIGCNGVWTLASSLITHSIIDGQTLCVRMDASATPGGTRNATIDIGGRTATFSLISTSTPADIVPNAFAFSAQSGVPLDTVIDSGAAVITGIAGYSPVTVMNGWYSIGCSGTWTQAASFITNGQTICARHASANALTTSTTSTVTIGGVQGTFTTTTAAADTTPDPFSFTSQTNVPPSVVRESDGVIFSGITTASPISVTAGTYSIGCNGVFTAAAGTVSPGQRVCVRHTSAATSAATVRTTLVVGDVSGEFASTTLVFDTTPDAFTFADQSNIAPGT